MIKTILVALLLLFTVNQTFAANKCTVSVETFVTSLNKQEVTFRILSNAESQLIDEAVGPPPTERPYQMYLLMKDDNRKIAIIKDGCFLGASNFFTKDQIESFLKITKS